MLTKIRLILWAPFLFCQALFCHSALAQVSETYAEWPFKIQIPFPVPGEVRYAATPVPDQNLPHYANTWLAGIEKEAGRLHLVRVGEDGQPNMEPIILTAVDQQAHGFDRRYYNEARGLGARESVNRETMDLNLVIASAGTEVILHLLRTPSQILDLLDLQPAEMVDALDNEAYNRTGSMTVSGRIPPPFPDGVDFWFTRYYSIDDYADQNGSIALFNKGSTYLPVHWYAFKHPETDELWLYNDNMNRTLLSGPFIFAKDEHSENSFWSPLSGMQATEVIHPSEGLKLEVTDHEGRVLIDLYSQARRPIIYIALEYEMFYQWQYWDFQVYLNNIAAAAEDRQRAEERHARFAAERAAFEERRRAAYRSCGCGSCYSIPNTRVRHRDGVSNLDDILSVPVLRRRYEARNRYEYVYDRSCSRSEFSSTVGVYLGYSENECRSAAANDRLCGSW